MELAYKFSATTYFVFIMGKHICTWGGAQYICTLQLLATEQLHSTIQVPLLKGTFTPAAKKHLPYFIHFPDKHFQTDLTK